MTPALQLLQSITHLMTAPAAATGPTPCYGAGKLPPSNLQAARPDDRLVVPSKRLISGQLHELASIEVTVQFLAYNT
jgi:hypothetical protein